MSAGLGLFPNVGGEERSRGESPPAVASVARLWRLLFARDARWLGEEAPPDSTWPATLGAASEDADALGDEYVDLVL